jgi:hypothetical protein
VDGSMSFFSASHQRMDASSICPAFPASLV